MRVLSAQLALLVQLARQGQQDRLEAKEIRVLQDQQVPQAILAPLGPLVRKGQQAQLVPLVQAQRGQLALRQLFPAPLVRQALRALLVQRAQLVFKEM